MTAMVLCKGEHVCGAFCDNQTVPRIGDTIIVDVDRRDRKFYTVKDVVWMYRYIDTKGPKPREDHRVEIHVKDVEDE